MATLQYEDKEVHVEDGQPIIDAAEELGVPFGCQNGLCGACLITVKEGLENLNTPREVEKTMNCDFENGERLACQCEIQEGTVVIDF